MSQKSQIEGRRLKVESQKSKVLTCDLRPSTFDPPESSDLRPATCDFRLSTRQTAFTLIELVVTMVIMAIIALVTVDYLVNAGRVYTLLLAQRQADGDAMAVVKRMRREARMWQANNMTASTEWAFSTRQGNTNSFRWSGNEVLLNNNTLAKNIQTFQLNYYDATNWPTTNATLIRRVALELRVTNNLAASESKVNFFLREGFLK